MRAGEVVREVEDVARAGGAKAVDRLKVVADHGQFAPLAAQAAHDLGLQAVDVLILVDEHVLEGAAGAGAQLLVGGERAPVQQQIVQVE